MSYYRRSAMGGDTFQDGFCSQSFTQKRRWSPGKNMYDVSRISVLYPGQNQHLFRADLRTGFPVLLQARRGKTFVVFGHHQDTIAPTTKFSRYGFQRQSPVVGPGGMNVARGL